jgi:hypothetical protein
MRRALLLGAVGLVLAAATGLAIALPAAPAPQQNQPRITRLFIPAIKEACLGEAGLPPDYDLGYTFTEEGALVTLDRDGSVTGLPSYVLYVLNGCLAQYPVHPPEQLPTDRYSRNLLYEYFGGSLKPCLEARVSDDLPAMPSRSNFVVRLYLWDPYKGLAPGRSLNELLNLESQCPALPRYLVPD